MGRLGEAEMGRLGEPETVGLGETENSEASEEYRGTGILPVHPPSWKPRGGVRASPCLSVWFRGFRVGVAENFVSEASENSEVFPLEKARRTASS